MQRCVLPLILAGFCSHMLPCFSFVCSGHDIRRSGRDLRDVFSLDLSQLDAEQGGTVVWTNHQLQVPEHTFGRETCNVVFGSKIVAFGGSVAHMRADEVTDNVYWFDTGQ